MQLDEAEIREFADLWSREFGETLTPDQARLQASLLLELYAALAEPAVRVGVQPGASSTHEILSLLPQVD
ncbi:MAG: hypothetical protein A49_01540 [Methyloceanibacter sp.]|nr:MAG: hypothetical protein A49_01540 [Methyloceanibacter sp.]